MIHRMLALTVAMSLSACAAVPPHPIVPELHAAPAGAARCPTEDAAFRTTPPTLGDVSVPAAPHMESFVLDNGLRVFVVEQHRFPSVAAHLFVDISRADAGDIGGAHAYLVGQIYLQPPEEIRWTTGGCSASMCSIKTVALAGHLDEAVQRLATIASSTSGPREEYARRLVDAQRLMDANGSNPHAAWGRTVDTLLFGHEHRYGHADGVTVFSLGAAAPLRDRLIVPRASSLVVVGDTTASDVRSIAAARFASWTDTPLATTAADPPPPLPPAPRLATVEARALSHVLGTIAARGPAVSADDYPAFHVLAELLGAPLSSAAQRRVREEMTAAYAVGAQLNWYPELTVLTLGGAFEASKSVDGMRELLALIASAREQDATSDALALAKGAALAAWRRRLQADNELADVIGRAASAGTPPDAVLGVSARIAAVTAAEVRDVARRYLDTSALRVVLVGRHEPLQHAEELGMGTPTPVDFYGSPRSSH
jgi:zinc protease